MTETELFRKRNKLLRPLNGSSPNSFLVCLKDLYKKNIEYRLTYLLLEPKSQVYISNVTFI